MNRREFIAASTVTGIAALTATASARERTQRAGSNAAKFSMHFAPHFGMFGNHAGDDMVAQLEFAADQGFTAWEDNSMAGRSTEEQERFARAMDRLGMTMGIFVMNMDTAWGPNFSQGKPEHRDQFVASAKAGVDVCKRVNTTKMTVVIGTRHPRIDLSYQTANAVDSLRAACEVLEPHGLTMVLEPLNPRDHPNMLLAELGHGYEICRAVNSPACKILDDLYHQQVTEGNLIPHMDEAWSEIGYFQIGDNPGRNEPTTGETNYANVFAHIKSKGYTGVLGMEHGNSRGGKEGEQAVIDAYRACDPG